MEQQMMSNEEKTWGMACHLAALAGFLTGGLGSIIGPLVVWLIKKDQFPFVNDQGKESLNFQISILIYLIISAILMIIGIGIVLVIIVAIFDLVEVILASIKANEGVAYRYPLTIRFIK